ncbi:MAG: L,D-transpeptidase, partial [Streptomyces sp.]|uniref:L,D-transpeptidase n=1 Tax=Streptomyces sp. TaxID=1931 RepID=UPI003D6AA3FA
MEMSVTTLGNHRRAISATAVLLGGVLTLSACGSSGAEGDSGGGSKQARAGGKSSEARIKIASKNGAEGASINTGGNVTVSKGKLTDVTMVTAQGGAPVEGTVSGDGKTWKPADQLERATQYKITAKAKDGDGRKAVENSTFTTVSPDNSFIGSYTGEDGQTVGVGMPVSINFDKAIGDKKAVQSAIKVKSSSGQQVVGHWFDGTRLDFRPQEYWKPGSKVTLDLNLDGVKGGPNMTGVQDKKVTFNIGRSQVSTVDVKTKQMTVVRDGAKVKTIPISAGGEKNPTYNGQMVISEKFKETRMNGATVGFTDDDGKGEYDIKDVPHAIRLTTSGTFLHGNYWAEEEVFGEENVSHGCIGLRDAKGGSATTPGGWFFDRTLIGDVVEVVNSKDRKV